MRVYDKPEIESATGRVELVVTRRDGSTDRIDMGIVPSGFSAPIPGDEIVHEGRAYEVTGVADTPQSEFSLAVMATEK